MSQKTYTEREVIELERDAAQRGGDVVFKHFNIDAGEREWEGTFAMARRLYPLPKVTRPREARDMQCSKVVWSVRGGLLMTDVGNGWTDPDGSWGYLPARIAMWADLFANPNEEVEDES